MDEAHGRILLAINELKPKFVLDLGCGNGLLLDKILQAFEFFTYGVDNHDANNPNVCMDIYDFKFFRDFDLVLIAEQRMEENPEAAKVLVARIKEHTKYLCIYNYNTGSIRIETFPTQTQWSNSDL